ncbi:MAG TPA: Type 1 glutamine amidotransferase-like domain-containing protein [Candidatus Absconditabacterales bacterium]|nr:Type 1 glutamine amidotransferase-like domain-containing protein [Candidatus Absconditabacterales bacterium]
MKFLLHGGMTSPRTEKNKKFFQHVVKEGGNKILIFPFAQKNRNYDLQFELDSQKFIDHNPDVDIECVMASDDIEVLIEQIKEYKSLYFCGGLQEHHLEILRKIDNLKMLLDDKVISGNSAGAMIRARHFFTGDYNRLEDGLGWLPIKVMVHWKSEKYNNYSEKELEKLKKYGEDLPIYKIREQEYEVFQV